MNDQLQQRLLNFTAEPPGQVWDAVRSELDQQMPGISHKLSEYGTQPPKQLWEKIESGLEKPSVFSVIPFYRKRAAKLMAAAVILLAVFLGVRSMVNFSGQEKPITSFENNIQEEAVRSTIDSPTEHSDVDETKATRTTTVERNPSKKAVSASVASLNKNRYITVSNEDGRQVRLSKKIVPVFDCAGDKIKVKGMRCREDIKSLQEKIGSSFTSPSADFAGLIDMLKSLEENR